MAEIKTKETNQSVHGYLAKIEPEKRRVEGLALLKMFEEITGETPKIWGSSIIGFGKYHYKSERSSQEGDWPLVGFSPRKQNLTLYIMQGNADNTELLTKLGKHKQSVGCIYINKLADINENVLRELIKHAYEFMKRTTAKN